MTVKILKTLLMLFIVSTITACSTKPTIKYVDRPYKVNVPVKCIVPDANCSFNRDTYTEVINSMLECIIDMKHNEKVCK